MNDLDLEQRLTDGLRDLAAHAPSGEDASRTRTSARSVRSHWPRTTLIAVAAAAAVAGIVASGPLLMDQVANNQPSGAEFAEGGGDASPPTAPTTSPQQPAQSTVDEVAELLSRHAGEPGYGKVVVDYLGSTVRLYWKGTLPADLTRLRNSTVKGVTIEIVDAKYSESDLVAAGQQAAALIEDRFGEGTVAATMPNETMSGIVVEIVRPWSGSVQDIEEQIGLPVTVRLVDEGPVPADE